MTYVYCKEMFFELQYIYYYLLLWTMRRYDMDTLGVMSLSKQSPKYYTQKAFSLMKNGQLNDAIQWMDTAIIFSHNAPFYIFKKITLLYHFGNLTICNDFILSQLNHLYKNGSLYILCRTLCYFQRINHYDINTLKAYLNRYQIPCTLADSYHLILRRKYKLLYKLADKAMVQDDYPLSISYLQLCLKCAYIKKNHSDIYYKLGRSYHMLGRLLDAKRYYELYYKLQPSSADAYVNLGLVSMELQDFSTAIQYFNKACLMAPNHTDYPLYLGECFYLAKRYPEAVATYEMFLKKYPNNLQAYFNLSHTYKKMSKYHLSKHYTKFIYKQLQKQESTKESTHG